MNFELLIARRIISGQSQTGPVTGPIIKVAIGAVAVGMCVMILAVCIVTGFQKEVRNKLVGFSGQIQISNLDDNSSFEKKPMDGSIAALVRRQENVKHAQVFATKAGIIKTDSEIEGIVLKGIGADFDWSFFNRYMVAGKHFDVRDTQTSNEAVISRHTADKLRLKCGDNLYVYFIQQPPRARKLHIAGIFDSGMEEMDKTFLLCDIGHIQKLNDWKSTEVAGVEVYLDDFDDLNTTAQTLNSSIGFDLQAKTIKELHPQLFDWLGLQDLNALIIMVLIVMVCAMNMVSAILILILERIGTIGILKTQGASDKSIRKVFVYIATYLLGIGLLAGNALGIGLCLTQKYLGIMKLDQSSYYLSQVPINFSLENLTFLNFFTIFTLFLMIILPTAVIVKLNPLRSIRFK